MCLHGDQRAIEHPPAEGTAAMGCQCLRRWAFLGSVQGRLLGAVTILVAGMAFRVITYNPLSLLAPGRSTFIEQELAKIDVVILPGTRVKQNMLIGTPCAAFESDSSANVDWATATELLMLTELAGSES